MRTGFARRAAAGAPPARRVPRPPITGRPASVLCALFEEAGESYVILTRRSSSLRSHTGEVSFPGGRLDPGEAAVAGALREASEEVGIDPAAIEVLGPLIPLVTVQGRALITPFVGVLDRRPILRPSPAEVERAFDVSLAELVSDGVYREELWHLPEETQLRAISFFELEGDTVWGATAWMLRDLLELTLT